MPKPIDSPFADFESRLLDAADSKVASVRQAARHLLEAGGKRARPRFAAVAGGWLGSPSELSTSLGMAAELVHTATLLHDDVIDRSELRRGRPSVHTAFGVESAVLTGDFLLARALQTLTGQGLFKATHELTLAVGELVEGELQQAACAYSLDTSLVQSRQIAETKTGALFAWCARAHAVTRGVADDLREAADRLGRLIGYGFQVADDLLDLSKTADGKPTHRDLREGRLTVPVQLARAARPELDQALADAFRERDEDAFESAYLALASSQAVELGSEELERVRTDALQLVRRAFPGTEAETSLATFFERYIARRF